MALVMLLHIKSYARAAPWTLGKLLVRLICDVVHSGFHCLNECRPIGYCRRQLFWWLLVEKTSAGLCDEVQSSTPHLNYGVKVVMLVYAAPCNAVQTHKDGTRNRTYSQSYRGFESSPLRQKLPD